MLAGSRPNWNTINHVWKRSHASNDPGGRLSVLDSDVPTWQREGTAWSNDQQGMLALSILQGYPIGQILLWEKPGRVFVPMDGRQRLTAILRFRRGETKVPTHPWVPAGFRGKKYCEAGDADGGKTCLTASQTDDFDSYTVDIISYPPETPESVLMDVFVRLQSGSPLNKAEVRGALGTEVAQFVTELTHSKAPATEDEDLEEDSSAGHPFFASLGVHYRNRRKSHRQVCDQLLNEYLNGDTEADFNLDHHWETLTGLYRTYAMKAQERAGFRAELTSFRKAFMVQGRLSTGLQNPNSICTWYRVWRHMRAEYALPAQVSFGARAETFEAARLAHKLDEPFKSYATALAASGYTAQRNRERARIVREWLLADLPKMRLKDPQRLFNRDQKYVIWHRAGGRCEWIGTTGSRCTTLIRQPQDPSGHADHLIRHREGGATTVENGQLLCQKHNLAKG